MPVAVLGLFQGAVLTRFVRASVLEVIRLDYVNTARAKGLSEARTIGTHVVCNALIPVVTVVALQVPAVFAGAVVTEQIFRVPGVGSLLISAILASDTPVVLAITFVYGVLVVASTSSLTCSTAGSTRASPMAESRPAPAHSPAKPGIASAATASPSRVPWCWARSWWGS
jgi:ABC-type microcin C transport system permease subunit YejB